MKTKQEFYLLLVTDCTFLQKWTPLGYSEKITQRLGASMLETLDLCLQCLCLCAWRKWCLLQSDWILRTRTLINWPAAAPLSSTVTVLSISQSPFQPHSLCLCCASSSGFLSFRATRRTTVDSNLTHLIPPTLNRAHSRNSVSSLFQTKQVSSSRGIHPESWWPPIVKQAPGLTTWNCP